MRYQGNLALALREDDHRYSLPGERTKRARPGTHQPGLPETHASGKKKIVLVIEDESGFREIFSDILEHGGYRVLLAENGREGWELIKSAKPDLVLLDLMLPEIPGTEVLKNVRAEPATKEIPVVIVSILDEQADVERGFQLGANDYIPKSRLSHLQILQKISNLLEDG